MIEESLMVNIQPMGSVSRYFLIPHFSKFANRRNHLPGSNRIPQVVRRGPNIKPGTLWLLADNLLQPYTRNRLTISPINVFLIQSRSNDPSQALRLGNANANPDTGIAEFSVNINNREKAFDLFWNLEYFSAVIYRERPIMPAILVVKGTKYACNLDSKGD